MLKFIIFPCLRSRRTAEWNATLLLSLNSPTTHYPLLTYYTLPTTHPLHTTSTTHPLHADFPALSLPGLCWSEVSWIALFVCQDLSLNLTVLPKTFVKKGSIIWNCRKICWNIIPNIDMKFLPKFPIFPREKVSHHCQQPPPPLPPPNPPSFNSFSTWHMYWPSSERSTSLQKLCTDTNWSDWNYKLDNGCNLEYKLDIEIPQTVALLARYKNQYKCKYSYKYK